jgi:hypothetical protein
MRSALCYGIYQLLDKPDKFSYAISRFINEQVGKPLFDRVAIGRSIERCDLWLNQPKAKVHEDSIEHIRIALECVKESGSQDVELKFFNSLSNLIRDTRNDFDKKLTELVSDYDPLLDTFAMEHALNQTLTVGALLKRKT